jgi:hypothetical protein
MANGCFNAIRIDGEKENLDKILEILKKAGAEGKFFDLLYPIPDELRTEEERFGDEWCVDHWGVKWDTDIRLSIVRKVNDKTILLLLYTEGTPPVPFLEKFSRDFQVDVEIRYVTSRNDFIGKAIFKNGKLVSNERIENPTPEDLQRPDLDFSKVI